ncbi:lipase family alpha/beta hydrolase [Gluconobacter morbifer]|nr:alpha/beta fold hydrolase [Gluconobacter morbifer]
MKKLPVLLAMLVLSGCAAPVSVHQLSLTDAYNARSHSALGGDVLSDTTRITLRHENLLSVWRYQPAQAVVTLRLLTQRHVNAPDFPAHLFALAELSYQSGRRHADRAAFMAAALYAYAYLNPDAPPQERPSPYAPQFRQACDIYMFGLTEALGSPISLSPQRWQLPFAMVDLTPAQPDPTWHSHAITDLRPLSRSDVRGFRNVYTQSGLGEPVAALPHLTTQESRSFQIFDKLRVPMNLLLTVNHPRDSVLSSHVEGHFRLTSVDDAASSRAFPLQFDPTAARALSLGDAMDWSVEYRGFLDGRLFDNGTRPQLLAIEPHQYGHRPVVLIHGTASSAARWADMANDLLEDPKIREHYEFWFFSYATGNPIPYSALQLRKSLEKAVSQLGGVKADPALGHMTLIGHSQGGLLAKMLTIQAEDRLWDGMLSTPLNRLKLSPADRTLLYEALFPAPLPEARSVIFISTPQHGSYLAGFSAAQFLGRMVTFPLTVQEIMKAVFTSTPNGRKLNMRPWRIGSIYGMSPRSSFIQSLAAIPVAPGIKAHSIIPVLGNGPLTKSDDGVVAYQSAHISDVNSELVVRHSGHSTQSNPVTIAEVRRILLEQLEDDGVSLPDIPQQRDITEIGGMYIPVSRTAVEDRQPGLAIQ